MRVKCCVENTIMRRVRAGFLELASVSFVESGKR